MFFSFLKLVVNLQDRPQTGIRFQKTVIRHPQLPVFGVFDGAIPKQRKGGCSKALSRCFLFLAVFMSICRATFSLCESLTDILNCNLSGINYRQLSEFSLFISDEYEVDGY